MIIGKLLLVFSGKGQRTYDLRLKKREYFIDTNDTENILSKLISTQQEDQL